MAEFAASAYTIRKLENITGVAMLVEFDKNSNTYIATYTHLGIYGECSYLYKLGSDNNIIFIKVFRNISKILINNQNTVFIFGKDFESDSENETLLWRLKPNSTTVENLLKYKICPKRSYHNSFIDYDDNIFFNMENGVAVIKSNSTFPIAVSNLEKFAFKNHAEDDDGNVYLYGNREMSHCSKYCLAVITRESKDELVPCATSLSNRDYSHIKEMKNWGKKIILLEQTTARAKIFTLMKEGTIIQEVFSQYSAEVKLLTSSGDRFFWISKSKASLASHIYFYDSRGNYLTIVDENFDVSVFNRCDQYVIDSEKNFFISGNDRIEKISRVLNLNPVEITPTKINVQPKKSILSMAFDNDDNLWVLTDGLYVICGNEAIRVSESEFTMCFWSQLKINKRTNDVFIMAGNGLFICSSD